MFEIFKDRAGMHTSPFVYPEQQYLRRIYQDMFMDVKSYYRRYPKYVNPKNIFAGILMHFPQRWDLDDHAYLNYIEDYMPQYVKTFGMVSSISRGKSFNKGVTLGPKSSEVVYAHAAKFDIKDIQREWVNLKPLTYIYHTRTDLNLPIMNNTTPGKAFGVTAINLPMLALKYRYWIKYRSEEHDSRENIFRFIGGFVLPDAIESYLDIALFNRIARRNKGIGSTTYPTPHPFYITDTTTRIERFIDHVNEGAVLRSKDLIQLAKNIPMISKTSLFDVIQRPADLVTRQNEWVVMLFMMPYVKYIMQKVRESTGTDERMINAVRIDIQEARWDNTVKTIGDPWLVEIYNTHVEQITELL